MQGSLSSISGNISAMMNKHILGQIRLNAILITVCCFVFGCKDDDPVINYEPFIDNEGNVYPIGKMCDGKIWMLKNLSVLTFRNGDSVPYVFHEGWKDFENENAALLPWLILGKVKSIADVFFLTTIFYPSLIHTAVY
jgi:hypothetical protein